MNAVTTRHRDTVVITLPIRARNPLNGSQAGWRAKAKVRKQQRLAVALALRGPVEGLWTSDGPPTRPADQNASEGILSVLVTRIAPRQLDAWDGLGASLKGIIDGVADALGTNDGDKRIKWAVDQRRGKPKEYAVEISLTMGVGP